MKNKFRFHLCLICMFVFAVAGCKVKRPSDVISESKMENLLYDYHVAKSMGDNLPSRIYAGFGIFSLKEDNINVSNGYGRGDNYRRNSACITKSRNSKNICWNRSKINCICFR